MMPVRRNRADDWFDVAGCSVSASYRCSGRRGGTSDQPYAHQDCANRLTAGANDLNAGFRVSRDMEAVRVSIIDSEIDENADMAQRCLHHIIDPDEIPWRMNRNVRSYYSQSNVQLSFAEIEILWQCIPRADEQAAPKYAVNSRAIPGIYPVGQNLDANDRSVIYHLAAFHFRLCKPGALIGKVSVAS